MASEALPTDQATDGIVQEKKDANNIKDTNGENVSQPIEIEGKDEEVTLKVESSTDTEKVLIESEEKPEAKSASAVEIRKEDEDIDRASGSDDLIGHCVEEVDDFKKEAEISIPSQLAAEVTAEDLKSLPNISDTPVPPNEEVEKSSKDFEASSVQELESEASKDHTVSEPLTEKAKGEEVTEPSTIPSSISEAEDIKKELPMVSTAKEPAAEVITEGLKNQPYVSNIHVPSSEEAEKPNKDFEASSVQESESEASKEQAASEPTTKKVNGEEVTLPSTIPSSISEAEGKKKELPMVSTAKEPAAEVITEGLKNQPYVSNTPVPSSEEAEKPNKDFEASSVQEPESEASKEQAASKPTTEKVNGEEVTLPSTIPSSISEAEDTKKELPMVYTAKEPADEVTTEELKNLPDVSNTPVPPSEETEKPNKDFEASSVQESESEASKEEAASEPTTEKVNGEEVTLPSTIPSSISEAEDKQKELPMVYTAKEPADEVTTQELKNLLDVSSTPVPPSEEVEKRHKDFEASSVQESESEASNMQAVSEPVTQKLKGEEATEPFTIPSSISEEEDKERELLVVSTAKEPASTVSETLVTGEGAKASQDENKKVEETVVPENSDAVVTDVAKLQEAGKGAVALETTDAPEETDARLNADGVIEVFAKEEIGSSKVEEVVKGVAVDAGKPDASAAIGLLEAADASSVIKITEYSMKPEGKVEEQKQENIIEAEEPNLSDKSKIDAASEIRYEGEKVTGSTEKVEEKKDENLEGFEANLMEPSKHLYAATGVSEVPLEGRKVFEGKEMVEDKDENFEGKEEITKGPDAASIIAEPSSQEEKASESSSVFGEAKDEGLNDEKISAVEISKDFDAASEVAEISTQEKVSKSPEIVAEEKEESLESEKATLLETIKGFDAAVGIAQVSTKDEKSSVAAEMVKEKKDGSLEGERPRSVETSRDLNVAADISGVSSGEEKTSCGGTGMAQEKKNKVEKCPESTETINEKSSDVSESARKTLGETFKEHDLEEKNVTAASAAERIGDSEEVAKDKEFAKDVAETGKRDDGGLVEPSKDVDITKQDKEAPKQVVPKSSQRHSNNIISKVKHSIVKAKRAILGKSPTSKSLSAGTKDDIKVK